MKTSPAIKKIAGPLAAAVMIGLVAASFIWLKEYRPFGKVEPVPALPNVGLRLVDAQLAGRSNGHKAWIFKAKTVEVSQDRARTTFTDLNSGIVYDQDHPAVKLSARRLDYNSFSKSITAQGRIRVVANNRMSVGTEYLTWDAFRRKLVCPSRVTIDMGGGKGSAESLIADLAHDRLVLRKVNLSVPVNEKMIEIR